MKSLHRAIAALAVALLLLAVAAPARAAFNNGTPRGTFAGTHNYLATGNTLRTADNGVNACSVGTSSTATISSIPAGSTILAAYLYWGGSGTTVDSSVSFGPNGSMAAISADDTFTNPIPTDTRSYFGGFKNVTAQVTGNGTYQFGGLTVDTSAAYCNVEAVVAAWSLVVFYSNPSESYRFTRIYDGLQFFRGSSVTTTQSGFRVPDLLDGKVTVVTWEGDADAATSTTMDGYDETLTFDGYPLINSGCDQLNNLYNSTIGTPTSCSTAYGVDIDTYDVTSFLYPGQTGATLYYSSGNDRVFLAAQVISTTNTPVADLGITKSHSGNFTAGQNGSFTIGVTNYGPEIATGTATVTDVLPAGLTFVSGTGTGWSCSAADQTVTCANSATTIPFPGSLPNLTLNVAVSGTAAASVQNTATVSHPMFDGTGGNQSATDTVTVLRSNLATSTKTVTDVNGGSVNPGDVLQYTITLTDTGGQGVALTNVSVVDDLPANVGGLTNVVASSGTDQSVGSGGVNGTGQVKVTGISIAAGGSATIQFDVTISGAATPGSNVTNTATVTNPSGTGATPSVTTAIAAAAPPASGNKRLYLQNLSPTRQLTRVPRTSAGASNPTLSGLNGSATWALTGALVKDLTLNSDVGLTLVVASSTQGGGSRALRYELLDDGAVIGTLEPAAATLSTNTASPTVLSLTIPISEPLAVASGSVLSLRVTNITGSNANREVTVYDWRSTTVYSYLSFATPTVINVDTVDFYSDSALTTPAGALQPNETLYVRAVVSDPFGGYDVASARLTLTDPNGVVQVANLPMTAHTSPTNDGLTSTRVFKYAYAIPTSPAYGNWIASVTATEGTETPALATHTGSAVYSLAPAALSVTKASTGTFVAGSNGVYTLTVNNTSAGAVSGTTTVKDTLATGLTYVSATGTNWSCNAAGQVVTCTSSASIAGSSSMAPITLTVAIAGNMGNSVDNTASVGNSTIAGGFMTAGNTLTTTILHPNLSTSTKTVVDLDGGDADPADNLRYTITVKESAGVAASNISVTDAISGSLENFAVNTGLTTCNGTDSSTSTQLNRTGISLAASGTCLIVFDVKISAVAGTGLEINNTATITNPAGPGATPAAPAVVVSASQQPASGNKYLYVYSNQTMSRVPHATTGTVTIAAASSLSFTLGAVAKQLVITPGSTIQVNLWLHRTGDTTTTTRNVYVQLLKNGVNQIGANSAQVSFNGTTAVRQQLTISVPSLGGAGTLNPGDTLVLKVFNATTGANRGVILSQWINTGSVVPAKSSLVSLTTATVVNVDDVSTYAAAFPATTTRASHSANDIVYFRATISDPFGGSDVGSATISVTDNNGVVRLSNATMTAVATGTTTRTFEYAYSMPSDAQVGIWTASVTGNEGTEGIVSHTGNFPFGVGVSRLELAKSHVGNFVAGGSGSYTLVVHNNGLALTGTTTVTDTLPAGLTYVSASGSNWSCGAVGQVVTCTTSASIGGDANLPAITLDVAVGSGAASSLDNVAAVSHPSVNSGTPQNSNTDTTLVVSPDLSTSTKTVVETTDGGDVDPGNTLRYTITVVESAGAAVNDASVTDDLPAGITGFTVVSIPAGATDSSTGVGTGANGTGHVDVTGIDIAASGSVTVVVDVVVGSLAPGDTIDNTATVANPSGPGANPSAPTVLVSQSQVVSSGNKKLYLHDDQSLDRTPQAGTATGGVAVNSGTSVDWVLAPAIPANETLVLSAGTINIDLVISTNNTVALTAQLYDGATLIGASTQQSFSSGAPVLRPFQVTLGSDYTLDPGDTLTLRLVNSANGNKNAQVYEYSGAGSVITFPTSTVVNVDSVLVFAESFSNGNATASYYVHGDTVFVRAIASDPFGADDVSAAELTLTDALGTVMVNAQSMTAVASDANSKTFEFAFQIPPQAGIGNWSASVIAHEGSEGTVTHVGIGSFELRGQVTLAATWGTANAGDAVSLQITGGSDAAVGSSIESSTSTPATAAATSASSITLGESFSQGIAGNYTITLACTRDSDAGAVAITGAGLSGQITMPTDSSVTCTFHNTRTIPLTVVKLNTVDSDPVNGQTNPKAIPGALVTYTIIVTNPAPNAADANSVFVTDQVPANTRLILSDFSGTVAGPVSFTDVGNSSGLSYTFVSLADDTDDLEFDDGSDAWAYDPDPGLDGIDPLVTGIRVNPKGLFSANGGQFTLNFRVKVQ